MPKVTQKIIDEVATLARLKLTDDEKKRYAEQLSAVFDYIAILDEVDVRGIEETCQVTDLEDVVREDIATDCDPDVRKKLIESFPEKTGNLLKVRAVFDQEL